MDTQTAGEAFSKLMQEHRKIIFKICHSYCTNKVDIDDLAQEIVYQLWKSYNSYSPDYKFTTWMYRIALNVAISFYRKEKKSGNIIPLNDEFTEIADRKDSSVHSDENINLLQQFISELKALDRALMILYLEGKNYKEIAEIIGITETNTATKISRIKLLLKQKFSTFNQ
jgi:RNA polymerase sigma-70 factor (ECF subfamily)